MDLIDTVVHYCSYYMCSHAVQRMESRQHIMVLVNTVIRFMYSRLVSPSPNPHGHCSNDLMCTEGEKEVVRNHEVVKKKSTPTRKQHQER
jgi:hypothetical protein